MLDRNHLTACKMSLGSFKNVIEKMSLKIIYLSNMYKVDLVLTNLQWLICYKTQPSQLNLILISYGCNSSTTVLLPE